MENIERLKQEFPTIEVKEIPGGANLHTRKGVITVYFRKRKFMVNQTWKQFGEFDEFLMEVSALIHVAKKKGNPPSLNEPTSINTRELKTGGFLTAEQTLDWHVQDASDNFDANYRQDCIEAIEAYHMQFSRGLIQIPDEFKSKHTGVQDIIDHITRKIEFGKKNGMSNSNLALLIALNQEITQYI